MRTACLAFVLASLPGVAAADACAGVRCSGHGDCMVEAERPFCFCDEGWAAEGMHCRRAERAIRPELNSQLGGRIVYVASSEADRRPEQVGALAHTAPYELRRYVTPGQMWCSEFISWVYQSAGVPFTGGYEGGWLLRNNIGIRTWFERRSLWVSAQSPEWRTFRPQPGDYVRMHTQSGNGHSAIVRYVLGETLYTVEGNVGNRVRLRTHRNFRDDRRIDGMGILVFPSERRAMLDRSRDPGVLPPRREHAMESGVVRAALVPRRMRPGGLPPAPRDQLRSRRERGQRRDVGNTSAERPLPHLDARRPAGRREPRA